MKKNELISARVAQYQNKRGIRYATIDGTLYKFLKILYILLFACNFVFNSFYLLVKLISYDSGTAGLSGDYGFITVSVCTVLLIAGLVLTLIRKTRWVGRFLSMAALCTAAVVLAKVILGSSSASDFDTTIFLGIPLYFYLRHGIPALLGVLTLLWMTLIDVLAIVRCNRLYRRLEDELYRQFRSQTGEPTDENWQSFLAGKSSEASDEASQD